MEQNSKILLGLGLGVVAVGAYFALRPSAPPVLPSGPAVIPPSGPGSVAMDVTGTSVYVDPNPNAPIDPTTRTLADAPAATLMKWLSNYYLVSFNTVDANTTVLGATILPTGKAPQNPDNMVPVGIPTLQKLGYNILITADVGQAVLADDNSKLTNSIALAATKDPAQIQNVMHKSGYVWLAAAKVA